MAGKENPDKFDETMPRTDWQRVVYALRDTAKKGQEQTEHERENMVGGYGREKEKYKADRYSRDWLIGRIEGIADTIEAMLRA